MKIIYTIYTNYLHDSSSDPLQETSSDILFCFFKNNLIFSDIYFKIFIKFYNKSKSIFYNNTKIKMPKNYYN